MADINVAVSINFTAPDRDTAEAEIRNLTAPEGATVSAIFTEVIVSGMMQEGKVIPPDTPVVPPPETPPDEAPPEVQHLPAQEDEPPA